LHDPEFHQLGPHPVQCQNRLLRLAFNGDKPRFRLLGRGPDTARVGCIRFVSQEEGSHRVGCNEPYVMTKLPQLPGPMVSATTGFNRDN
jgi:hypothetical protein